MEKNKFDHLPRNSVSQGYRVKVRCREFPSGTLHINRWSFSLEISLEPEILEILIHSITMNTYQFLLKLNFSSVFLGGEELNFLKYSWLFN